MRPQCRAYSMTEIGNRKKRKAFLYEFPGSAAQRNHRDPVLKREAHKNKNQGAKRPLIPLPLLQTHPRFFHPPSPLFPSPFLSITKQAEPAFTSAEVRHASILAHAGDFTQFPIRKKKAGQSPLCSFKIRLYAASLCSVRRAVPLRHRFVFACDFRVQLFGIPLRVRRRQHRFECHRRNAHPPE